MSNLKKNLIYHSAYQVLMVISPFITYPYVARTLGNEMYGVYTYYHSVAYYFGIFTILGLANYGNRTIAKIKDKGKEALSKAFFQIATMQVMMLIVVGTIYCISIPFWAGTYKTNAFLELLFILYFGMDISWFFFGIEDFVLTTRRSFVVQILTVVGVFLFVKSPADLNVYTIIIVGGMCAGSLILWPCLTKYVSFVPVDVKGVVQHIKPNLVLFIPVISITLFHYSDKVMLGMLSSWEELGYYANSDKVVTIPMNLINGLGMVMLPRISALSVSNKTDNIEKYLNKSIQFSLWFGMALCFGIKSVSIDFIPLFFGKGYMRCVELLEWLSVGIVIKAISHIMRTQYLIPLERDREYNISVIAAAIINIIINYKLIPELGAMGAVWGTLVAETVVLVLYGYFSKQLIDFRKAIILGVSFIVAGFIMNEIIEVIRARMMNTGSLIRLIIEVFVGGTIYCILTLPGILSLKKDK